MRVLKRLSLLRNKHLVVLMNAQEKEEAEAGALKDGADNLSDFIREAVREKVERVNRRGN